VTLMSSTLKMGQHVLSKRRYYIRQHDAAHKMVTFILLLFSVTFLIISLPYYFIPYVSHKIGCVL
jgi:hypothetical protein